MNSTEYRTLARVSREIEDEFYKCVAEWLRNPKDASARKSCFERGREYENALMMQLEYLKKLRPSRARDAAIEATETYYAALETQLSMLGGGPERHN